MDKLITMHSPMTALILFLLSMPVYAQSNEFVFIKYGCDQCHGGVGQGGAAGLRLAPEPLPFEDFADIVRRPYGVMPAYSPQVLNDIDIEAIHAYLVSIPQPPALRDIPLLAGQ